MARDPIVQEGDPVLRQRALPVPKKDIGSPALAKILKKMHAALAPEKYGVAIAAPQIGESLRIFVVAGRVFKEEAEEVSEQAAQKKVLGSPTSSHKGSSGPDYFSALPDSPPNRVYINPELTRASRKKLEESEGCLSVRGMYGTVMRHERVTLSYLDEAGKAQTQNATGLLGHIFQHEVDHLNGVLFIDKAKDLHESN
jgi:peptide deformylase